MSGLDIQYQSAVESYNILQDRKTAISEKLDNTQKKDDSALTLQLDNSFFNQFAELVRNDKNDPQRIFFSQKVLELGESRAALQEDKFYFEQLLKFMNSEKAANNKIPSEIQNLAKTDFNNQLEQLFLDINKTAEKVYQFRDLVMNENISSRSFYIPYGNVLYQTSYFISPVRILFGLLACWFLFNLVVITFQFYQSLRKSAGKN